MIYSFANQTLMCGTLYFSLERLASNFISGKAKVSVLIVYYKNLIEIVAYFTPWYAQTKSTFFKHGCFDLVVLLYTVHNYYCNIICLVP